MQWDGKLGGANIPLFAVLNLTRNENHLPLWMQHNVPMSKYGGTGMITSTWALLHVTD